jgi:hypothetical protein
VPKGSPRKYIQGFFEGFFQGRAEEAARAVLIVLRVRGLDVPDAVRERTAGALAGKGRRRRFGRRRPQRAELIDGIQDLCRLGPVVRGQ